MNETAAKSKPQFCQGISRLDEPCDKAPSSIARCTQWSAELISPTDCMRVPEQGES